MKMKNLWRTLLSFSFLMLLASCSDTNTAGNSVSETTNGIEVSGVLYNSDGSVFATQTAYLVQIQPDSQNPRRILDSTTTNSSGEYSLRANEAGEYYVFATAGTQVITSPSLHVGQNQFLAQKFDDSLKTGIDITGSTDVSYSGTFFVRLHGTPWHVEAQQNGSWTLEKVLPGSYTLELVQYFNQQTIILERREIVVEDNQDLEITESFQDQYLQDSAGVLLVDDFENQYANKTYINSVWWIFDDEETGKASTIEAEWGADEDSTNHVGRLQITMDDQAGSFVGAGFNLGFRYNNESNAVFNLSNLDSVQVQIKGDAHSLSLHLIGKNTEGSYIIKHPEVLTSSWQTINFAINNPVQLSDNSANWDDIKNQVAWVSLNFGIGETSDSTKVTLDDVKFFFSAP